MTKPSDWYDATPPIKPLRPYVEASIYVIWDGSTQIKGGDDGGPIILSVIVSELIECARVNGVSDEHIRSALWRELHKLGGR